MSMLSDEIKKIEIDEEKTRKLKRLIIEAERDNLKTKEYSNSDMILKLKEIIEKVVTE